MLKPGEAVTSSSRSASVTVSHLWDCVLDLISASAENRCNLVHTASVYLFMYIYLLGINNCIYSYPGKQHHGKGI